MTNSIEIKNAHVHNLKNIDISILRDQLVVITGLSGSGKSSLAFDTIYAEGQRRYVESLSSYARQFLGRMQKPEVDYIKGIPPAIAIEQKVSSHNTRSTVGTSTEIYDYMKLLFARVGRTYSPVSNKEVKKHGVDDVVHFVRNLAEESKIMILSPLKTENVIASDEYLKFLMQQGINRLEIDESLVSMEELTTNPDLLKKARQVNIVVDRLKVHLDNDTLSRVADSVQTAFDQSNGECLLVVMNEKDTQREHFSNKFEQDGIAFEEPHVHMFSFNNPLGACPTCEGYGKILGVDENLVIPDMNLSVYDDAVVCWKGEVMKEWKDQLVMNSGKAGFPIHKPYYELSQEHKDMLWNGTKQFEGINDFFNYLESKKYKIQYRVMLARYRGKTTCPACKGTRLKKEASYVKINKKSISDLVNISIEELRHFFRTVKLTQQEQQIAQRLLIEIQNRIDFLCDVGLNYLTLNRLSSTLSGGESQRINLATSLGSSLVGSLYILDEPSIGLHPRDNNLLIKVLKQLRDIGNTVIVVEHDEEIIRSADSIIDIGPLAGRLGGELVFSGPLGKLQQHKKSLTAQYLDGRLQVEIPEKRRKWNSYIQLTGARENNLKNIQVRFPLGVFTVVTGVSGSGKSSLVGDILYPALSRLINGNSIKAGAFTSIEGDTEAIKHVEFIDQNPIGKSSRSNPVTYIKAFDEIRKLFSIQQASKINGYTPSHFSLNVTGGRCEECQGEGEITIEMQFMADVHLVCESCNGKKFKDEILDVAFHGKNIYDVLEMTVNEAMDFFSNINTSLTNKISEKIKPLQDVGLGYVKLGQSSSTLSGGESQRVKLASFLSKGNASIPHLFIFDEPTTGLHFHDISKLMEAFNALINHGHSIIVIEHNLDVIKSADWIIDLGPEGGEKGGHIVFEGTPEELVKCKDSYTGKFLKGKLA